MNEDRTSERLRTIRLAMYELQKKPGLSMAAKERGLRALRSAYEREKQQSEQVG